jgi:DNA repair protein RecN (Recombination protein N)
VLSELQITNFAIIENQSIRFEAGLNVLTGETGSGKSIILAALELILGGRSSTQHIRTGHDALEVHALFDLTKLPAEKLSELPDIAQTEELAVSRILSRTGRGKVYINGALSTVAVLQEIGNRFINICSQSQHIKLLLPEFHLELLDGYLQEQVLKEQYRTAYTVWHDRQKELVELQKKFADREARQIWLEETIEELAAGAVQAGLRADLETRYKKYTLTTKLQDALQRAQEAFEDDDGLLSAVSRAQTAVSDLIKFEPGYSAAMQALMQAKEYILDADKILKRSLDMASDEDIELISEQLTTLARLERKHKTDDAGLAQILTNARQELARLGDSNSLAQITAEVAALLHTAEQLAERLSAKRLQASKKLAEQVSKELSELNMSGAKLSVSMTRKEMTQHGIDDVEFLLMSNPGEPPKPLRTIASGGELSRIMLVLKKILRDRSGVNVLVFDEVDTGISGGVARAVGQKLKSLSKDSQVICITHLPQVASYADHHLLVEKSGTKKVSTSVRELAQKGDRIEEIARMLSGFEVTESSKKSAEELIATAT